MSGTPFISVLKNMVWVSIEKFGYSFLSFCSTIILARLLTPEEYGILGIVSIFISLSQFIVESGLGSALVKKENPDHYDYSTIFTFSLVVSIFLYIILFFSSTYIASYYNKAELTNLIKVSSFTLIINSFTLIQRVQLIRQQRFKQQSFISTTSLTLSVTVAILLAYYGFGIWSLIIQQIIYTLSYFVISFLSVRYNPSLYFDLYRFRELFKFGGGVSLASIIQLLFNNAIVFIIGKAYSIHTAGLYFQASKLIEFPISVFRALIDNVAFTVLARLNEHKEFYKMSSKITRGILIFSFPIFLAITVFSDSVVLLIFGDEWVASSPYLSVLGYGALAKIIEMVSNNILKSKGEVGLLWKFEIIKKVIGLGVLILLFRNSLNALLWGIVFSNFISCVINMFLVNKISFYTLKEQLVDILTPILISALSISIAAFLFQFIGMGLVYNSILLIFFIGISYILLGFLFNVREFNYLILRMLKREIK